MDCHQIACELSCPQYVEGVDVRYILPYGTYVPAVLDLEDDEDEFRRRWFVSSYQT